MGCLMSLIDKLGLCKPALTVPPFPPDAYVLDRAHAQTRIGIGW